MLIQVPEEGSEIPTQIDTSIDEGKLLAGYLMDTVIEDNLSLFLYLYGQIVDAMNDRTPEQRSEADQAIHTTADQVAEWFINRRVTKLVYDSVRHGWGAEECISNRSELEQLNANFKKFLQEDYVKYVTDIEREDRQFYGDNLSDDSDSDSEGQFFSDDSDWEEEGEGEEEGEEDFDRDVESQPMILEPRASQRPDIDMDPGIETDEDGADYELPDEDEDIANAPSTSKQTYRFSKTGFYPGGDGTRSRMPKGLRSPFKGRRRQMRKEQEWSQHVAENATIHDTDGDWTAQAIADLNIVNEALKSNGDVDKLTKTKFCVAQYRGISYNIISFGAAARRRNREKVEICSAVYASSVFESCGVSPGEFYAGHCDPEITTRLQVAAHQLRDVLVAKRFTDPIVIGGREFENHAYALQDLYTKNYDAFHFQLQAWAELEGRKASEMEIERDGQDRKEENPPPEGVRQELWPLFKGLPNGKNPFVSTGNTPRHALRYAYGIKYYEGHKHERLRPRWRRDGRAERPYAGKVYISLHPCSDYLYAGPLDVVALNRHGKVSVVSLISAERESSFPAFIPEGQVVEEHIARYPSFRYKYKPIFLHKYGLHKEEYDLFRERIVKTVPHSSPHKKNKLALGEWLVRYYEARLVEIARLHAKQLGMLLVYRDEDGSLSRSLPADTAPLKTGGARDSSSKKGPKKASNKLSTRTWSLKLPEKESAPLNAQSSQLAFDMIQVVQRRKYRFLTWLQERFEIRRVPADGNCLFHALSRAIPVDMLATRIQGMRPYDDRHLRSLAVEQMRQEQIEHPLAGNIPNAELNEMNRQATSVLQSNRWGTDREVGAIARALQISIRIYSPHDVGGSSDVVGGHGAPLGAILYHGGGDHWEWLVPKAAEVLADLFEPEG
ncbi:MAG TPA: hypothetical protein VN493_08645 [Thermoanaerobaculia bacterium]|nr:hypothetical protein [Thermoanaerobaculia bacterium]